VSLRRRWRRLRRWFWTSPLPYLLVLVIGVGAGAVVFGDASLPRQTPAPAAPSLSDDSPSRAAQVEDRFIDLTNRERDNSVAEAADTSALAGVADRHAANMTAVGEAFADRPTAGGSATARWRAAGIYQQCRIPTDAQQGVARQRYPTAAEIVITGETGGTPQRIAERAFQTVQREVFGDWETLWRRPADRVAVGYGESGGRFFMAVELC